MKSWEEFIKNDSVSFGLKQEDAEIREKRRGLI